MISSTANNFKGVESANNINRRILLTSEQRGILLDTADEFLSKNSANTADDCYYGDDQKMLMMEAIIDDLFNNSKQIDGNSANDKDGSCERNNISLNQSNQELTTFTSSSGNLNKSREEQIEPEDNEDITQNCNDNEGDNRVAELQMDVNDEENDITEQEDQSLTVMDCVENHEIIGGQQDNVPQSDDGISYKETDETVPEEANDITCRQDEQDNIMGNVKSNDIAIEDLNGDEEQSKKRKQSSESLENKLPKQRKIEKDEKNDKSIGQLLKHDKHSANYFVQLLEIQTRKKQNKLEEEIDEKKFRIGCVNTVLSYLNNYMNNLPENGNINMEEYDKYTDDNLRVWHAERIGDGGFGNVLKLIKRNNETMIIESTRALKVIPNSIIGASEAIIGAKLNHTNVVTVYNLLLIRYICCIEMEYVTRGSLKDLMKQNIKLSKEVVKNMLFQCFEVLLLMKQQGMVHSGKFSNNFTFCDHY